MQGLSGIFHGGQQPVSGTTIQLYAVGAGGDGTAATPLITKTITTSDGSHDSTNANANAGNAFNSLPVGEFTISGDYTCPSSTSQVYIVGTGGNPGFTAVTNNTALSLMAALGECGDLTAATYVSINELTTIGSIAPVTGFMTSYSSLASGTGDANELASALAEVNEYTDTAMGTVPGPALPAGYSASSTAVQTLADIVAGCVNSSGGVAGDGSACGLLFMYAMPPGDGAKAPTDTIGAVLDILNNPTNNASDIYGLLVPKSPFQPTLPPTPTTWALPITSTAETKLEFKTQPSNTVSAASISPSLTVAIEDAGGNVQTSAVEAVTLAIGANPSSGTLSGMTTVTAVDGIATFPGISINKAGTGYTLAAWATGLSGATSNSFNITAGVASKLAFTQQPGTTTANQSISPAVLVSVEDSAGNVVTTSSATITVGIGTDPSSGSLSGTTQQTASGGVASFPNLSINSVGNGYTLSASSTGLTAAVSNAFNVTGGAIGVSATTVGNNLITQLSLSLPANSPATEKMTLTSADPTHFLLSTTATAIGSTSVQVTLTQGSANVPAVYLQGQNYTGNVAITANVTATANGFSDGSGTMTLDPSGFVFYGAGTYNTTTFSSAANLTSLGIVGLNPGSLTLQFESQPLGPQAGSVGPLVITSSNTTVGTVTGTGPTFNDTTSWILSSGYSFQPKAAGTTTLTLTQPPGYYTSTSSGYDTTQTVNVSAPAISVNGTTPIANYGVTQVGVSVPSAPTTAWTLNLSTTDSSHFSVSTNPNVVGTSSLAISMAANSTNVPNIYVEGQNFSGGSVISTTLTVSATGFTSGTGTLQLYPSGFGWYSGGFTTTTFSGTTGLSIGFNGLNPGTLTQAFQASIGPQANNPQVAITSGTTSVGTINGSPATWTVNGGTYQSSTLSFQPAGTAGTSALTITEPTGYYATQGGNWPPGITATVNAPAISVGAVTVANNSLTGLGISVPSAPNSAWTLTVTSADSTHFLLTTNPNVVGTPSLTINMAANSNNIPNIYVEGQNYSGNVAITGAVTASATGFTTGSNTLTLYPSGFGWYTNSFSTTTFSSATSLTIGFNGLNPGTLTAAFQATLGPQAGNPQVTVTSGTTSVGTISGSPATWVVNSGTYQSGNLTFQPASNGSSVLTITEPTGYYASSPSWPMSITATVNAPAISVGSLTIANNSLEGLSISVPSAPNNPWVLTITSGDPTHFLLSTDPTVVGTASLMINMAANSGSIPNIYVEGQNYSGNTAITAAVTASATNFTTGSNTLTLFPSGFGWNTSSFNTTTTSSPTTLYVGFLGLNPGTLVPSFQPSMGPQAGNPQVVITSGTPGVGTIDGSPATWAVNGSTYQSGSLTFVPAGQTGTSVLTITQPSGFSAPNASNWPTSITANVPE